MKKRIFSIFVALCMIVTILPMTVVATVDPNAGLCEHHTSHTGCSYSAGTAEVTCTHEHTDACYSADGVETTTPAALEAVLLNCGHTKDGSCCYKAAVPATACDNDCELCAGEPVPQAGEGSCSCTVGPCTETSRVDACAVCRDTPAGCKIAPALSITTKRTSASTAEISISTTPEDVLGTWTYYYAVNEQNTMEHGALSGSENTGTLNTAGDSINITGLESGAAAYYFHIFAENTAGVRTSLYSQGIAAYQDTSTLYRVTVTVSPADNSGGTVTVSGSGTGTGEYAPGEEVTISAAPNTAAGYCAARCSSADISITDGALIDLKTSHTFEMPEKNVEISITFAQHAYGYHKDNENGTHDDHCLYCGNTQTAAIDHVDVTGPYGAAGADGICDKCTAVLDTHSHNYAAGWSSDAAGHWNECICGAKANVAAHISSGAATADKAETCTVCGYEITPKVTTYTLTLVMADADKGGELAALPDSKIENLQAGEVVDLSDYWPATLEYTEGGQTYYFGAFQENEISGSHILSTTISGDKTLYAGWVTTPMITVIFDTNGGSLPYKMVRVPHGTIFDQMNEAYQPTRNGYDFVGWSAENDGTADAGLKDARVTTDCTIYAVWKQKPVYVSGGGGSSKPSNPPVDIGGDYEAILRDDVIIVRGDDPISGTLDLRKTNAEAIRLPADAVKASTGEGNSITIRFDDKRVADITSPGFAAMRDALRDGEDVQIAVRAVEAEELPDELTTPPEDDEPFENDEVVLDWDTLRPIVIFTGEKLLDLGVISADDEDITWEELKYLYHHMTAAEINFLRSYIYDTQGQFADPQLLAWLAEMIERDAVTTGIFLESLQDFANLTDEQMLMLADMGLQNLDNPSIGQIRQLDLTLEQMQRLQNEIEQVRDVLMGTQEEFDALLSWLEDAIDQKELEASYAQMDEWIAEAAVGDDDAVIEEVRLAAQGMTTAELEVFLNKLNKEDKSAALEKFVDFLNDLLKVRKEVEAEDAANNYYINVGGERAVFVGAIEADVKAVKANGTTRDIEILADRSNAVAWSTTIERKSEQQNEAGRFDDSIFDIRDVELDAGTDDTGYTYDPKPQGAAVTWDESNIRAYKVLENGGLEAKAAKVTENNDGTLTASVLSNGNSTYIFVLEPNPYSDIDEDDWYYEAAMTMDQQLLMGGTTETTFGGDTPTSRGMIATILYRMDGSPAVKGVSSFADVTQKDYFHNAVVWANENGIASGYGDGAFGANDLITREQLATMLWKFAKYQGQDVSVGENTNILSYNDAFDISEYAIPAVQWACGEGILSGKGEGNLDPQGNAKRSETASMLMRFLEG